MRGALGSICHVGTGSMWCQAALGLIHGYPEGSLGMPWQHVCDG